MTIIFYFKQIMLFWILFSSRNPYKKYYNVHKNIMQQTKKMKSAYNNDFWRSCDTEAWSNDAENSALITGINYIKNVFKYKISYFKLQ